LQHFFPHQILGQDIFFPSLLVHVFLFCSLLPCRKFFFKITPPPPPPSKVKWSAPHAKFLTERHKCFIIPSQFSVSDHNKNLFTDINVY
jgi:hypothetical protein